MSTETAKVVRALVSFTELVIKGLTSSVTNQLYIDTPELTGFAETNWLPTIGEPATKPAGTRSFTGITKAQQDDGIALVNNSYSFPAIVYITNPVSYILDLNNGSSAKAPAGFVQTAIAKGIRNTFTR